MEKEAKETTTAVSVLDDYSVIVVDQERLQAFFSDGKNLDKAYGRIEKLAKGIVADIADIIEPELKTRIAGHSDPGYRLAAEESAKAIVKAILTGKINNLKVEY